MVTKFKRYAIVVLTAALGLSSVAQASSLDSALSGMFLSNSTTPRSFSTQQMGGLSGGGLSLRTPVVGPNIITFDPPRISAGCGGIDLFGGAFSFINAQELVALFRQIAANAVGVAFKAAIDAINPALGKLMQDFQNKISSLNNMMRNTCGIATTLVADSGLSQDISSFVQQESAGPMGAINGAMTDAFSGIDSFLSSPNSLLNQLQQSGQQPTYGNLTWMALQQSGAGQILGAPGVTNSDPNEADEIIMSLVGTTITAPPNPAPTATAPNGATLVKNGVTWGPTLTLAQLRAGDDNGQNPLNILQCQDGWTSVNCVTVGKSQITFQGIVGYTNTMLFGTEDGSSIAPTSIVGLMDNCTTGSQGNGCNFNSAQTIFIGSINPPVLGLMKKVQSIPGAGDALAYQLAPVIADELTERYGEAALQAVESTYSGTQYTLNKTVIENIKAVQAEMVQIRQSDAEDTNKINAAIAYAKSIAADNPAVFVKTVRH